MIKLNIKVNREQTQGETGEHEHLPAVSFEESRPSSKEAIPPPTPPCNPTVVSPSPNSRKTHGRKASADKSGVQTPVSLPGSPKRPSKLSENPKKCASLTSHSRNSSVHSILTECDNSDLSVSATEKEPKKNIRSVKVKHLRVMAKKRQEIMQIQKLLTHQQKTYINLYTQIKELEARSGIDSGDCLGKIRLLTMKGWPAHDLLLLVKEDATSPEPEEIKGVLGPTVLEQLQYEMSSIPKEVSDMGNELLARRAKLLEYCRKRALETKLKSEFDTETDALQRLVYDTRKALEARVNQILYLAKISWKDRYALIAKIESLNKELCNLQDKVTEAEPGESAELVSNIKPDELMDKLNKERAARESLKHMVATAEGLLRTARGRITVLERELKAAQKQMQSSARKHKEYQLLHRCRETSYDVRSKKLLEESKTGEVTIEMLTLQRDALEIRVKELQEQIKTIIEDYEARESQQRSSMDRLKEKVDEQEKHRLMAEARGVELEKRIKDIHDEYRRLLDQSNNLVKMSSDKCLDYLPRKENEPTLTEAQLWKDLQATKNRLEQVTAELKQSREDKESLLNSLAKIAQEGSENNMGSELLLREQKIFRLQELIEEFKQNIKSMNENLAQKDRQINLLRIEASRTSYECCSNDSPKQELALEVMELTSQVAVLTRERESLMTAAMSRALMLERHERCADIFAQVTRARRDIVAQLEGQQRPHSEGAFAEANLASSLSPASLKAAETWSELRSDRKRLLQLQDVVASQNLQLKRERRVRNQLEQRRAILERLFLNRSTSNQYDPAENVATYLGASSYLANDALVSPP